MINKRLTRGHEALADEKELPDGHSDGEPDHGELADLPDLGHGEADRPDHGGGDHGVVRSSPLLRPLLQRHLYVTHPALPGVTSLLALVSPPRKVTGSSYLYLYRYCRSVRPVGPGY